MSDKYEAVNGQWPEVVPALEGEEAISAAKRLYRFGLKRKWRGKWALTSGRRYTWPRGNTFYVNPNGQHFGGWRDLVHLMSHYCHRQLHPTHKPHDGRHHFLEKEMVEYVIRSGWLDGRLRSKRKPKVEVDPIVKVDAAIKRWETKLKRASTALSKLRKKRRRYG